MSRINLSLSSDYNPQSRAWVDWFPFTGTTAIAATDLDNDGTDDLIGVWPGSGMWAYQSSIDDWQLLTTYFPEKMSTGDMTGNGQEDIIASWSQFGAYYRDSVSGSWPQLVGLAPDTFDAGDITGDGFDQFVGSWEGYGIYSRDRNDNWVHLTTVHARFLQ